jgi:hypothetical protein
MGLEQLHTNSVKSEGATQSCWNMLVQGLQSSGMWCCSVWYRGANICRSLLPLCLLLWAWRQYTSKKKTLVTIYRDYSPENHKLNIYCLEDLKSHMCGSRFLLMLKSSSLQNRYVSQQLKVTKSSWVTAMSTWSRSQISVSDIFTAQVRGKISEMLECCYELMQLVSWEGDTPHSHLLT